jgi:hypothetical protein
MAILTKHTRFTLFIFGLILLVHTIVLAVTVAGI